MYAVIKSGGKQERVEVGQRVDVELLRAGPGEEVSFRPVLVVDGDLVLATPDGLADVTIAGLVVGQAFGPKIDGFTYKPKTRSRRRFGHRQRYTTVQISSIDSEAHSLHASLESLAQEAAEALAEAKAEAEVQAAEAAEAAETDEVEVEVAAETGETGAEKTPAEDAAANEGDEAEAAEAEAGDDEAAPADLADSADES
jgi:large subunit ribosomal protein L21